MKRIAQIKADDSPTDVCGRYPFVSVSSATSAFQRLPFLDVFTNRKNIGWYGENTDQRKNGFVNKKNANVKIDDLNAGIYFIKAFDGKRFSTTKIVVR